MPTRELYPYVGPGWQQLRTTPRGQLVQSADDLLAAGGEGARLSVAVMEDGRLYVGDVPLGLLTGGHPVRAAGWLVRSGSGVTRLSNDSRGHYGAEPEVYTAFANAFREVGVPIPARFEPAVFHRRCPVCAGWGVVERLPARCRLCEQPLPEAWNCEQRPLMDEAEQHALRGMFPFGQSEPEAHALDTADHWGCFGLADEQPPDPELARWLDRYHVYVCYPALLAELRRERLDPRQHAQAVISAMRSLGGIWAEEDVLPLDEERAQAIVRRLARERGWLQDGPATIDRRRTGWLWWQRVVWELAVAGGRVVLDPATAQVLRAQPSG